MSVKPQPLAASVQRDLSNRTLSVILGYSDNAKEESNTTQSANAAIAGFQYATKINPTDIKLTTNVPQPMKLRNSVLGRYRQNSADLAGSNSPLWVYDNAMFVVLGSDGWRSDEFDGNTKPIRGFSDITGKVAKTSEGIYYQCVNVLPTLFGVNSGSRYSLTTRQDLTNKYDKNSTAVSKKITATNICGSGNETRIGNCCLYYPNTTKDTVSGITYSAGDFYDCVCTQCHKCVEMARKLDMRYVFNAHTAVSGSVTGGTGPSCQCMADFPNNCGPCACKIETPDVIDKILNDKNISTENSDKRNALIEKNNKAHAGFIAVWMDLSGINEESRVLDVEYQVNGSKFGETPQLPISASTPAGAEAIYRVSTYRGSNGKLYCRGLTLVQEGFGYIDGEVDSDRWKLICPNIPVSTFTIHVTPFVGFFGSIEESTMFRPQVRVTKQITGLELKNAGVKLDTLKLNRATLGTLITDKGTKVFGDLESGESGRVSLQTLVDVQKTDGTNFSADILGGTTTIGGEQPSFGTDPAFGSDPSGDTPPPAPPPPTPTSIKSKTKDTVSTIAFKTPGNLSTIELAVETVNPTSYESHNFTLAGVDVTSVNVTKPTYNDENIITRGIGVESIVTSKLPNEIDFSTMTTDFIEKSFTLTVQTLIG
tara:strand:+ start:4487 stop:6442 length:1956 start_codon:yes stop_codon:yes gene_type:complete